MHLSSLFLEFREPVPICQHDTKDPGSNDPVAAGVFPHRRVRKIGANATILKNTESIFNIHLTVPLGNVLFYL